ncbi:hypothetical protein [Cellulomonas sp. P24]|uniref:hypothetical protein n=1 Tax=Cellulomonas sp. P24 TaxID=2885206 RepID=UPI00216B2870|nr:hypothetical protein [Cellulomonas sp. P24]MCR6491135.1 hypothetical protein [Cellulomonas sp. P24]
MRTQTLSLDDVTNLVAHIDFGDSGVGGWPADGEIALSAGTGESWRGRLSDTALDKAERAWATRAPAEGPTDQEAEDVLRAAVDCDTRFYGLTVDWLRARVEVDGAVVRVAATVHRTPEAIVGTGGRRANVILELVDMHPTHAGWQVEDAHGGLADEQDLAVADFDAPDLGTLWERARYAWTSLALSAGLSAAEGLTMTLAVSDLDEGSCGELRVSAAVR